MVSVACAIHVTCVTCMTCDLSGPCDLQPCAACDLMRSVTQFNPVWPNVTRCDLRPQAVRDACQELKLRLKPFQGENKAWIQVVSSASGAGVNLSAHSA